MSDVPFIQQRTEAMVAKAIGERLAKSEAAKRKETTEEARKRVMAGVDPSRWTAVTRRDGAVRQAVQAAHDAAAVPKKKPRPAFRLVRGTAVYFTDDETGERVFAKILAASRGANGRDLVSVATTAGEWMVDGEDLRPASDAMMERERERRDRDHEADLEQQGVRLSKFAFDDLRPGMKLMVEGMYGTSQRGVVVYLSQEVHQFGVLRLFGTGGPVEPVYVAFTPSAVQQIQDEHGVLPPRP